MPCAAFRAALVTAAVLVATPGMAGCGADDPRSPDTTVAVTAATPGQGTTSDAGDELHPDVLDATARLDGDNTWTVSATLSSPYDSAERYADAWRVLGPDGTVFGVRELLHDHAGEQPFTRSLAGVAIPDTVDEVTIEGRDQRNGWGGATFTLRLVR